MSFMVYNDHEADLETSYDLTTKNETLIIKDS